MSFTLTLPVKPIGGSNPKTYLLLLSLWLSNAHLLPVFIMLLPLPSVAQLFLIYISWANLAALAICLFLFASYPA